MTCAVARLDSGDTCLRWCGPPGAVTAAMVGTALRLAAGGPDSVPWLLASGGFAPTHWFSTAAR